ncbi:MAG TPA: RodZ domain-containing protein [Acetobacteraceae bacterium]
MMSAVHDVADSPAAPRAGGDLRAARERLGWSIEMVADGLRIRRPHLEALEAGRIDLLPGNAYAVGFLRTYAAALGLDPDEIGRRFKAEAAGVNRRTELAFPTPMPERGMPAGALILLGVVLAVGAYAGWYRLSGEGRLPAETVIPVPQHLAPLAQQALPAVAPRPDANAAQRAATSTAKLALAAVPAGTRPNSAASPLSPMSAPAGGPGAAVPGSAAASGSAVPASVAANDAVATAVSSALDATPPVPSISPTSAAAAPMPPMSVTQLSAADQTRIVVQATADAWIEVKDPTGNVLLNRVLHTGDSWPVPAQPGLVLTTGNAGGTELVVDGVASPLLGNPGAVRRDLPLDPDLIKQGRLAPATPGGVQPASVRSNGQ